MNKSHGKHPSIVIVQKLVPRTRPNKIAVANPHIMPLKLLKLKRHEMYLHKVNPGLSLR